MITRSQIKMALCLANTYLCDADLSCSSELTPSGAMRLTIHGRTIAEWQSETRWPTREIYAVFTIERRGQVSGADFRAPKSVQFMYSQNSRHVLNGDDSCAHCGQ